MFSAQIFQENTFFKFRPNFSLIEKFFLLINFLNSKQIQKNFKNNFSKNKFQKTTIASYNIMNKGIHREIWEHCWRICLSVHFRPRIPSYSRTSKSKQWEWWGLSRRSLFITVGMSRSPRRIDHIIYFFDFFFFACCGDCLFRSSSSLSFLLLLLLSILLDRSNNLLSESHKSIHLMIMVGKDFNYGLLFL